MKKFETEMEKILWEMLYRSQMALADMCRDEMNRNRDNDRDWPCGMEWHEANGSSHAIFCRKAREKSGINHDEYLKILRHNEDALAIAEPIYSELSNR